jgi:uncharacterized protein with PIN domain
VPTLARQTVRCQDCNAVCRIRPTEIQIHGGQGQRTYWTWHSRMLCPACQRYQLDYWQGATADRREWLELAAARSATTARRSGTRILKFERAARSPAAHRFRLKHQVAE